ncbi:two-component regulator propeller domain-containing protein [Oxalobacteraceae bacterium A2-2]
MLACVRHLLYCCQLLAALCLVHGAAAAPLSLRFQHLGVEEGLAQESVNCMLQDRHGYMWFGTQAGLSRYDGYRMAVFKNDLSRPASLLDNYVQALYEDGQGRLWVGGKGGLDRYDPVTESFVHYLPPGGRAVLAVTGDGGLGLWVATAAGLHHFDTATGRFQPLRHDEADPGSIGDDRINTLLRDRHGALWVGTASGVELLAPGASAFRHYAKAGVGDAAVLSLSMAPDGVLWAGTRDGVLALAAGAAGLDRPDGEALAGHAVPALLHDADGGLWAATGRDGLRRRDAASGHWHAYRHDPQDRHALADNRVMALYQDRSGTLWSGTMYSGAERVDLASGGFERYTDSATAQPAIGGSKVRGITGAVGRSVWLAMHEGLTLLDPERGTARTWRAGADGLPYGELVSLATDRRNRLWIGAVNGLAWRDPDSGAYTTLALPGDDPQLRYVQRIVVDRNGEIWAAARGGLHRIDASGALVRSYLHDSADPASLVDGRIYTVLEDSRRNFWVAGEHGLDRMDRAAGTFRHYRHDASRPDSLCQDRVHALLEDSKGRLWLGTAGGLCGAVLDADGEPRFRFYPRGAGVPEPVGAIMEDEAGMLWISTTSGLLRFDPASGIFRAYSARDGLIDGSYFIGAGHRGPEGRLYFGGASGLTAFQPRAIRDNPYPPMVMLTDFSILNQSIVSGPARPDVLKAGPLYAARSLTLSYLDSVFTIEFAAPHQADPQRNRYAYQLVGFDDHWVMADAGKRYATYTNLDPGRYLFRVRAANKDGVWNGEPAEVEILIAPPFWKTWWFRILAVSLALASVYGVFRIRVRLLVQQKRELEQQVGMRTRELQQQKESVERQKEHLEQAHRNISLLSEIGRQITANLDSEAIMATLYSQVNELMDASVFGIGIHRPELELIEYPFAMERGRRYINYTRSMREPNQFAVWCIRHGHDVFINDLHGEYRRYIDNLDLVVVDADHMGTLEDGSLPRAPASLIYVPITVSGQVRGVITVHSYRVHAYQRVHLDMLHTLASYVAVAFENADTYRKLQDAQQQLVAREKLAALGALVAGVAHELNTPIGNSLVIASTLEDKTAEIASKSEGAGLRRSDLKNFIDAAREASALLMRSLRNAAELVNSFKQVAVDQASAHRRLFNLCQASQEITATMMNRIRKSGHRLELDIPGDIEVDSFPGPYGQVIINFINNALLHAFERREGGLMRLYATRLGKDRVRIVFQDDGAGIAGEHLDRIFDPFFTTKLGQGGSGLGLSVTYNIVTSLLGGQIRVESTVGVGTVFTLELPLMATRAGTA